MNLHLPKIRQNKEHVQQRSNIEVYTSLLKMEDPLNNNSYGSNNMVLISRCQCNMTQMRTNIHSRALRRQGKKTTDIAVAMLSKC